MRVQRGVPATFPVPTQRAHANTTGAARHSIGTSSGLHPEDHPYQTDERRPINRQPVYAEEEDDDRLYDVRVPTSASLQRPTGNDHTGIAQRNDLGRRHNGLQTTAT